MIVVGDIIERNGDREWECGRELESEIKGLPGKEIL